MLYLNHFFVLATQNPVEQAGTYPLPEAQLDRFLMFIRVGYPTQAEEVEILRRTTGNVESTLTRVLKGEELLALQQLVRSVEVSDALLDYVSALVRTTRPGSSDNDLVKCDKVNSFVRWGAGPRAGQALVLCAKAKALLSGRYAMTWMILFLLHLPYYVIVFYLIFKLKLKMYQQMMLLSDLLLSVPKPTSPLA